jgi:hypothetical protein
MPEACALELTTPRGFESAAAFQQVLASSLHAHEAAARRAIVSAGRGFLGAAKALAQKWWARPGDGEPRRTLNPRIAGRDKWKRVEALMRLKDFLRAYRHAWSSLRGGDRTTVFPPGTYALRVLHGVRCAAPT